MENVNHHKDFQVAEIQISYKSKVKASDRISISGSKDAFKLLIQTWDMDRIELIEQFKVILTNRANKVLGIFEVSTGGISGTVADPRLIFATALKAGAAGIILSHNHPSGNVQPSQADIDLTRKMKTGGQILEIQVLDHIIVTPDRYYSFADEGIL